MRLCVSRGPTSLLVLSSQVSLEGSLSPGTAQDPRKGRGNLRTAVPAPSTPPPTALGRGLINLPESPHKHQAWLLPQENKISDRKVIPIKKIKEKNRKSPMR